MTNSIIVITIILVICMIVTFHGEKYDLGLILMNLNILCLIISVLIYPVETPYKIGIIIMIFALYRRNISFCTSIGLMYKEHYDLFNRDLLTKDITKIFSTNFKLVHNFEKLPKHPTIFVCNYIHDRLENLACVLIPGKVAIMMVKPAMEMCRFNHIISPIICRKLKGKDFENIKTKIQEHINNGTSVFAYANHGISGTTGRIRTGLFKIAKKLNITITQIAIDNISSVFNCIPYQRFEIKIGETFYVNDPNEDAMKTHRFFSKSYKRFQKKKFMV